MVDIILREKQVKDNAGKLVGTMRVVVDEEAMETCFKDVPKLSTQQEKENGLKELGYTNEDISKIKAANLI